MRRNKKIIVFGRNLATIHTRLTLVLDAVWPPPEQSLVAISSCGKVIHANKTNIVLLSRFVRHVQVCD